MRISNLKYVILLIIILCSCGKHTDIPHEGGGNKYHDSTCIISEISQLNNGADTAISLSAVFDDKQRVTKLYIYDDIHNKDTFINFNYDLSGIIRLDQNQYFTLDGENRVIRFVTKSGADNYTYVYNYNSQGYLARKDLYINDNINDTPNLRTIYTYINDSLTRCEMRSVSSGDSLVLESDLKYDSSIKIRNWIYTFPDAIEGSMYYTVLNFGRRPSHALKHVDTKIYDPPTQTLLDTWETNYSKYQVDSLGYVLSGEATGDLQQGITVFYGKTNFEYHCP
jgi:hypothetical protein